MVYTVTALQTVADCDAQLTMANKEKNNLEYREIQLNRKQVRYAESSVEIADELAAVTTELDTVSTIVASLPEGEIKDDNLLKMKKLEVRKMVLEDRKESYGAMSLLDAQFELASVERQLLEVAEYIDAINTQKSRL